MCVLLIGSPFKWFQFLHINSCGPSWDIYELYDSFRSGRVNFQLLVVFLFIVLNAYLHCTDNCVHKYQCIMLNVLVSIQ